MTMDFTIVLVDALKAFFIVMFGMNVAVILTWADRRQGAVIQDRVGPNRAVLWLPKRVAQGMALVPALVVAAAIIAFFVKVPLDGAQRTGRAVLFSQLAIFIAVGDRPRDRRARRDPRREKQLRRLDQEPGGSPAHLLGGPRSSRAHRRRRIALSRDT